MYIIFSAMLSCLISICLTPVVIWIAGRRGWYDSTGDRKIHTGKIPRLGGVAMFWAFFISVAITAIFTLRNTDYAPWGSVYWPASLALIVVHFMGLADDFVNLRARFKFLVQVGAAILVACMGFSFKSLELPFGIGHLPLGFMDIPLTAIWIVGITNAVNMIDGMDGLAGGISLIAAITFGLTYLELKESYSALLAFALVGSVSGYLFFNFPPARVFMGDSGSYLLGFMLAILPLLHGGRFAGVMGLVNAFTILLIPILDVFAAMLRRKKLGVPLMSADQWHLHHKLMKLGFGNRRILAMIYAAQILLGLASLSSLYLSYSYSLSLIFLVGLFISGLFLLLHSLKVKGAMTERVNALRVGPDLDTRGAKE